MTDGPHQRRCWDCGNVAEHKDSIKPWVLCGKCGSQDTRRVKPETPLPQIPIKWDTLEDNGKAAAWESI